MAFKIDPKRLEDELLRIIFKLWRPLERRERVRRAAEEPQEEPKMVFWLPRSSQDPRASQRSPRASEEALKSTQKEPKSRPKHSQNHGRIKNVDSLIFVKCIS